ncbi:MAG: hypothetical protein C4291_14985, partial [Candidatus Dadabacteria bacterium]
MLDKYVSLPEPINIEELAEGQDYDYSPGGVTAMVYPLVVKMRELGMLKKLIWVSTTWVTDEASGSAPAAAPLTRTLKVKRRRAP